VDVRRLTLQLSSYGHSASSHGALIDFFLGGAETEAPEPQSRYSERVVLLPGMGIIFNKFRGDTRGPAAAEAPPPGTLVINCAWTMIKVNYDHLRTIAQVIRTVQQRYIASHTHACMMVADA